MTSFLTPYDVIIFFLHEISFYQDFLQLWQVHHLRIRSISNIWTTPSNGSTSYVKRPVLIGLIVYYMAKSSWFFLIVVSKWLTNHKNKLKSFKKTTRLIGLAFIRTMVKLESSQKLESSVCFFQELCLKHPNETVVCLSCSITSFLHLPNVLLKREKDTTKVKVFITAEEVVVYFGCSRCFCSQPPTCVYHYETFRC